MTNEELRELCEKRGRNIYLLPDLGGAAARDCTSEITALLDKNERQAATIEAVRELVESNIDKPLTEVDWDILKKLDEILKGGGDG